MSDRPVPLVGPVYGFRTWEVDLDGSEWTGGEPTLKSRGTTWRTPRRLAECLGSGGIFGGLQRSMAAVLYGAPREPDPAPEHLPATDPNCWCGLYAHSTLGRCIEAREYMLRGRGQFPDEAPRERHVLGLVKASGHMHAAERGFRASSMEIDTLVCLHLGRDRTVADLFRRHQPHVRRIANDLGVDVVCARLTKKSLGRAFADRDGVYLWRKEAPWTSDATPEPTKSSTPPIATSRTFSWETLSEKPRPISGAKSRLTLVDELSTFRPDISGSGGGAA